MGAFSFMPDPTADAFTPGQFMEQAVDQPFSRGETFLGSVIGGAEESFGLGTAVRSMEIDQGRRMVTRGAPIGGKGAFQIRTPETDQEVQSRGDMPLDKQQYETSPFFRDRIPWDQAMTWNRAQALATYDDRRTVREEMARKAPWTAGAGSLAGGALDPINYIPILGEEAAVAKLGNVAGRALVDSANFAANVGVAGLLTAPERARYGDDISWQSQVSSMALAAALGAGFGAFGGVLRNRAEARDARAAGVQKDIADRLSTIRNGQDSMATLREAVQGLTDNGEVNLGEASIDRLAALNDQIEQVAPESAGRPLAESADAYAARRVAEDMPTETRTLAAFDAQIAEHRQALGSISEELQSSQFDAVRQAGQEARALDRQHQALVEQRDAARSADEKAQIGQQIDALETKIESVASRADSAVSDRYGALQREQAARMKDLQAVEKERAPTAAKVETAKQQRLAEHQAMAAEQPPAAMIEALPEAPQTPADTIVSKPPRPVIATKPRPEVTPPEAVKAEAAVAKPETLKAVAEQHGVNAETGAIPEEFELAQVEKEGRLSKEDVKAMEAANENFAQAKSWTEALRAAVACLI